MRDEIISKAYDIDILHVSVKAKAGYIADKISKKNPDIVGFTTFLWNIDQTAAVSSLLKERRPETRIVWGGGGSHHAKRALP